MHGETVKKIRGKFKNRTEIKHKTHNDNNTQNVNVNNTWLLFCSCRTSNRNASVMVF